MNKDQVRAAFVRGHVSPLCPYCPPGTPGATVTKGQGWIRGVVIRAYQCILCGGRFVGWIQ